MNVQVKTGIDPQETVQDFMKKTGFDCARVIVRNLELLDTLGIVDREVVIAMVHASAVPGAQILLEGGLKPERVAAHYVLLAALEARKLARKQPPGEDTANQFMDEFSAAVAEPIKRFFDL